MEKRFTKEEQELLRSNPYTLTVSEHQIKFTVEFKRYLLSETAKPGVSYNAAFIKAGYDPAMLGSVRISSVVKNARKQAASPRGLHETAPSRSKLLKEDLARKRTQTAIRELQEEMIRLQQQVDFLKKTLQLISEEDEKP